MTAERIESEFSERFGRRPVLFRAPGRINLIGEHSDYNDGFVMPLNTAVYTRLAISPRPDRSIRVHSSLFNESEQFELDTVAPGEAGRWIEYVKGVIHILCDEGFELRGADLLIEGDIPLGGGLSSSASLEAAVATAMLGIAGHDVTPGRLAKMCKRAENEFVGVQCGIMDQYVITGCERGHAMKLDCRSLDYLLVPIPEDLRILVIDCGVKHKLQDGDFNQRRAECDSAARTLASLQAGVTALRDVTPSMLGQHQHELDEVPYRRARHVVSEIQRVHDTERLLEAGDLEGVGQLINASHFSLRDDFEVSCEELDRLTDMARACPGVLGSRMVGAGFGGCAITLTRAQDIDRVASTLCSEYADWSGQQPWWHIAQSADAAGRWTPS